MMTRKPGKMTWDAKSLMIDGKRIWIHDGEIHYFRFTADDWPAALLRARRAGLNTVSTYVAWCFHEENEGVFEFSGDHDLYRFVDIAHDMGLRVMMRVGPYMCGEWAGGGIPGWLGVRDDIDLRTNDPVFMSAVTRWFERLIPGLVERQATRGGPIISFQNENEYHRACAGPRRDYIYAITDLLRRLGVDTPITGCNAHPASGTEVQLYYSKDPADWAMDDLIITYNCPPDPEPLRHLRKLQPDAPLIATELWAGGMVFRTTDRNGWPEMGEYLRGIVGFFGLGAQVCYYMFDGGTNFGYWAGCNIATSYESDYPVREGGVVGERYRALRLVNMFASSFDDFMAESQEETGHGITADDGIRIWVRHTPSGRIFFIAAPDGRRHAALKLSTGSEINLALNEHSFAIIPFGIECVPGIVVDESNMSLFFRDSARRIVMLHAPAGTDAYIRVNGQEIRMPVGRDMAERITLPGSGGAAPATLLLLSTEMAKRCWPCDDNIFVGPDYVGAQSEDASHEMVVTARTPPVRVFGRDGSETVWNGRRADKPPALPSLSGWKSGVAPEVTDSSTRGWHAIDEPLYHDELGVRHGYVWFRAMVNSRRECVSHLAMPGAQGNLIVHVNGRYAGVLGIEKTVGQRFDYAVPTQRLNATLPIPLRKGLNNIVCLAEDCGHTLFETGSVGVRGPAFVGARAFEPEKIRVRDNPKAPNGKIVSFDMPLGSGEAAALAFTRHQVGVKCNGKALKPITQRRDFWRGYLAVNTPARKRAKIEIMLAARDVEAVIGKMTLHIVRNSDRLRGWAWKPFAPACGERASIASDRKQASAEVDRESASPVLLVPTHSETTVASREFAAAWHVARFPRPAGTRPVFLTLGSLNKGQIWLNGHNAGRYWKQPQTQTHWYLPRAWMRDDNELLIFEEAGLPPSGTALAWKEQDPYHPEQSPPEVILF